MVTLVGKFNAGWLYPKRRHQFPVYTAQTSESRLKIIACRLRKYQDRDPISQEESNLLIL